LRSVSYAATSKNSAWRSCLSRLQSGVEKRRGFSNARGLRDVRFSRCRSSDSPPDANNCVLRLMPNHWHFLLWPEKDEDLSKFMHWLTTTYASRWCRESLTLGEGALSINHGSPPRRSRISRSSQRPGDTSSEILLRPASFKRRPIPRPSLEFVNAPELVAVSGVFAG
jgi:hypothetical protein